MNVFDTISVEMKVDFKNLPKTFLKIHELLIKNFLAIVYNANKGREDIDYSTLYSISTSYTT